jgi:hypothetical protein
MDDPTWMLNISQPTAHIMSNLTTRTMNGLHQAGDGPPGETPGGWLADWGSIPYTIEVVVLPLDFLLRLW